jgi:hypothetical protein
MTESQQPRKWKPALVVFIFFVLLFLATTTTIYFVRNAMLQIWLEEKKVVGQLLTEFDCQAHWSVWTAEGNLYGRLQIYGGGVFYVRIFSQSGPGIQR